jgi:hypothetical protein
VPPRPVHVVKAGSQNVSVEVIARREGPSPRQLMPGLGFDSPGLLAAFVRAGEAPRAIALGQTGSPDGSTQAFAKVDPDLLPGVYRLGLPDEAVAEGVAQVLVVVSCPGSAIEPVEIELVAYDSQDSERMGLGALESDRHERWLRTGMPGLAKMELELWREREASAGR